MKHCAFLTMDSLEDFVCMDHLLVEPMHAVGWQVEEVSWRQEGVDWSRFQLVIIRSPWDYQSDPAAFLDVLEQIDSQTHLENSLSIVKWNLDKSYLRRLEEKGVEIVPTHWGHDLNEGELAKEFAFFGSAELILKPVISANAGDTFRISPMKVDAMEAELCDLFSQRSYMVQPFIESIVNEGEYSLFFFGGKYSHAILKTPGPSDFRVQEEHGGLIKSVDPTADQLATAQQILKTLDESPLYARVDVVRTEENRFALMEIELIEPSLYFDTSPDSIGAFIEQIELRWAQIEQTVN